MMINTELLEIFDDLTESYNKLKLLCAGSINDHKVEIILQRYAYIIDNLIKLSKILLKKHNIECRYPKECLYAAEKFGLINNATIFIDMLDDRYRLTQINEKKITDKLYEKISVKHIITLGIFLEKIERDYIKL